MTRTWQSDPMDLQNRLCNQIEQQRAEIERLKADNETLRRALDVAPRKPTSEDIEWARKWLRTIAAQDFNTARAALEPKP